MGCKEYLPAEVLLGRIAGGESLRIADTSAHTGLNVFAIYIEADTVFNVITAGGVSVKVTKGLTGTVLAGGLHTFNEEPVTAITLTSGSIIVYES